MSDVLFHRAMWILHRMSVEQTGWRGFLRRWYYHHEPLRHDASALLAEMHALKDDSFFPENKERRPFGDKGLQREDQSPPLSPVATNLSAMDQEWE